jgi:uncharacterized protein with PQ loop repeat
VLTILDISVTLFGVVMGASPLLQLSRLLRRRRSEDVSLGMLAVLLGGGALWLAYGVAHGLVAIMVGNAVGVGASAATLLVAWRYRRQSPAEETASGDKDQERHLRVLSRTG